jgi:hypothetical protein
MSRRKVFVQGTCSACGVVFARELPTSSPPPRLCSAACKSTLSSVTMARTNRRDASPRMKARNPMKRDEYREKMRATLHRIGHRPRVQGGNGRGPTAAETAIATALGWDIGVVVATKMGRESGYPTHYKLDVANPTLKVAIEVDGQSHGLLVRQEQDRKKEAFLSGLGWTVLRVSNREALEELPSTISKLRARIPTSPTAS